MDLVPFHCFRVKRYLRERICIPVRYGVVVNLTDFHSVAPGSIPGIEVLFLLFFPLFFFPFPLSLKILSSFLLPRKKI